MRRMFGMVEELTSTTDADKFNEIKDRIAKYEQISDNMENEIGKYLGQISNAHLSDDTKDKIRGMLRSISELESLGDSNFNLARILKRKLDQKITFSGQLEAGVQEMFSLLDVALNRMNAALAGHRDDMSISSNVEAEKRINECRNRLKQENVKNLDHGAYSYDEGNIFSDLIGECEQNGDYIINVAEARLGDAIGA